jgi:transposase
VIGLPSSVRIFLATEPADLRKGFDGLAGLVRRHGGDPFSGHLYAFVSRRRDRVKILTWDRGGFVVWYKRLERGRFPVPGRAVGDARTLALDAGELGLLLDGIDFRQVRRPTRWEPRRAA